MLGHRDEGWGCKATGLNQYTSVPILACTVVWLPHNTMQLELPLFFALCFISVAIHPVQLMGTHHSQPPSCVISSSIESPLPMISGYCLSCITGGSILLPPQSVFPSCTS